MTLKICAVCSREYTDPTQQHCSEDGGRLLSVHAGQQLTGRVLDGRFEMLGFLSRGGMGAVYRARQILIDREVAIKTLPSELISSADALKRFVREAKLLSRLSHPNVVTIHDFGHTEEGIPYLAMELLEGQTLKDFLDQQPVPALSKTLDILCQLCSGLAEAHRLEIIHRDLKPSNIMLIDKPGQETLVKILDFGVAKLLGDENRMTRSDHMVGTPLYMSPEQLSGSRIDHRTDLYAVGLITYQMLSGRTAVSGHNTLEVIAKQLREQTPQFTLQGMGRALNDGLNRIVQRCVAKHKRERYQTATELREQLEALRWRGPLEGPVAESLFDDHGDEGTAPGTGVRGPIPTENGTMEVALPSSILRSGQRLGGRRIRVIVPSLLVAAVVVISTWLFVAPPTPGPQRRANPLDPVGLRFVAVPNRQPQTAESTRSRAQREASVIPTASRVWLEVVTVPKGAQLFLDKHALGRTPFRRLLRRSPAPVRLRIVTRGYHPHVVKKLTLDRDQSVKIILRRRRGIVDFNE